MLVCGCALAGLVLLHVFISPINPAQEPPASHVPGPCWVCHFVSGSAKLQEVNR